MRLDLITCVLQRQKRLPATKALSSPHYYSLYGHICPWARLKPLWSGHSFYWAPSQRYTLCLLKWQTGFWAVKRFFTAWTLLMPMLGNTDKYKSSLAATVFTATSAMVDLEILQLGTAVGKQDWQCVQYVAFCHVNQHMCCLGFWVHALNIDKRFWGCLKLTFTKTY